MKIDEYVCISFSICLIVYPVLTSFIRSRKPDLKRISKMKMILQKDPFSEPRRICNYAYAINVSLTI